MKTTEESGIARRVARLAPILTVLLGLGLAGMARAGLQREFPAAVTNLAPDAFFIGWFTIDPPTMTLDATVTSGTEIVPQANLLLTNVTTNVWVLLDPVPYQSGWVSVEVTGIDGAVTNRSNFDVWFQPYPLPVIDLLFSTPATNAAPGAPFTGSLGFSPTNMQLVATIDSGGAIVPQANVTLTTNGATAYITLTPVTNKSGLVTTTVRGVSGAVTNSVEFDVWFRRYPPVISAIANRTMDEDGTNVVDFTVSYPDRTFTDAGVTFTATSDNTSLIDSGGLILSGSDGNRHLTMIPKANINGTAKITIEVTDAEYTVARQFNLVVNPVPDPPTISGVVDLNIMDDANATNILAGATIDDVDHNMPQPETLTVTVTLDSDVYATFADDAVTFSTSGAPAVVTAALRSLQLFPKRFTASPGTLNPVTVTVVAEDADFTVAREADVTIEVVNTPPDFGIVLDPATVTEGQSIQPFNLDYVNDPDRGGEEFSLSIDFVDPAQSALAHIAPTNVLADNVLGLQAEIRNLVFQTVAGLLSNQAEEVELRFSLTDWQGGVATVDASLTIQPQSRPPTISGIPDAITDCTDGDDPFSPLPYAVVVDPDQNGSQLVRATVALSNPLLGSLSTTNIAFRLPLQLTAALQAIVFTPAQDAVPVNEYGITEVRITVYDDAGLSAQNNNLQIRIKNVNNAPRLLNIPPAAMQPVLFPPVDTIRPFAGIGLTNDDGSNVLFTLTIDDPDKGDLGNLGGFVETAPGRFQMSGGVAGIVGALTNITFTLNQGHFFPADDPGGTVFTLAAQDFALLTTTRALYIQMQNEPRNHLVTRTVNDGAPGSFNYALQHAGNYDAITFALPAYPAIIRMTGTEPDTIVRHLVIKGPGANLLTISGDGNGDNVPDRQLFRILSRVTIEGVTMAFGQAVSGGAIAVGEGGNLTLRQCAVVDCVAEEFGGAIDVEGGALALEECFIGRNRLLPDSGVSGAGVSVYSDRDVRFVNTTFDGNVQANEDGDGGGALVVQFLTPGHLLNVYLTHCTFAGNVDASGRASAVFGVDAGTRVRPLNCIFGDFSGRNLDVDSLAQFHSLGGNICDDSTQTSLLQGEGGTVYLLDHDSDETETDPLLEELDDGCDPTPCRGLRPGSPAIDKGVGTSIGVDQRGVMRGAVPDAGAIEYNAARRLVLNEIYHDDAGVNFIELFVRRDSTAIDLAGYSLYIDDVAVHDFSDGLIVGTNALFAAGAPAPTLIQPGFGMVVAFVDAPLTLTSANNPTPVVGVSRFNLASNLATRGTMSVGRDNGFDSGPEMVARQSWLGDYLDPESGTNLLDTTGNSLSLAPQFRGFALVPHGCILPGPFGGADPAMALPASSSSPGADATGTPFGQDNAEPYAADDILSVLADRVSPLAVLDNDFDSDGNDRLTIVDVSLGSDPGAGDCPATNSALGALVAVTPAGVPLRGTNLLYDPRLAPALRQLSLEVENIDTFHYEIIDIGSAPVGSYAVGGISTTIVFSANHRLRDGEQVTIAGASRAAYNGTFAVTVLDENRFTIPVAYAGISTLPGRWETVLPRLPTSRSEAVVAVRVIGVNDLPVVGADLITNVTEASMMRVMIRPDLAGTPLVFKGDPAPPPDMSSQNLLFNDDDIDSDDSWSDLRVTGLMSAVHPIGGYSGVAGAAPVSVHAVGHGLASGDTVLIANYGGNVSYNGFHEITVLDNDHFTIPRHYVDDHPVKGIWVVLNEGNRYQIMTDVGAAVSLTLRDDPGEDHLVYDAAVSAFLDGLAEDEVYTNRFWQAVEDRHGAIGIGPVDVVVTGLNDTPVALPDPDSLDRLAPLVTESNTLADVLAAGLDLMYVLPAGNGLVNLYALDRGGTLPGTIELRDFFATDEDTPLTIATQALLANDSDIDRRDILEVVAVEGLSRLGAEMTLSGGGVLYIPTNAAALQALARGEMVVDSFAVTVSDGMTGGVVTSLVAVLVTGVNDTPQAVADEHTTNEDEVFVFDPRDNDVEIDIDGNVPDDRPRIVPVANLPNPGGARVDLSPTNVTHDATVSELLNQLADWQSFTNVFAYTLTDNSYLFAIDDEFQVPAGSTERLLDVLANDRNFTDAAAPAIVAAGPTLRGGTVTIVSNGQYLVYSSPAGFVGDDAFRYMIQNEQGDLRGARVVVRSVVPALNGILHAAADSYCVAAGETIVMDVLVNDNQLPSSGVGLTLVGVVASSQPGEPRLLGNAFVFDATNGVAPLTFTYAATAGGSSTGVASVVVKVVDRRGTLETRDDAFSVLPGSFDNPLDVLANDALVGAAVDQLRIREIVVPAVQGTLVIDASATGLLYTPAPGFIGVEQVAYLVTDQMGGTGTGMVRIAVGRIEAVPDFYKLDAAAGSPVALDVLANDRMQPAGRGSLLLTAVTPIGGDAAIGSMAVAGGGGHLEFSASNAVGEHAWSYTVCDASTGTARCETGRVSVVTVAPGTYANPDVYRVRAGGAGYELDVLANDIGYPSAGRSYSILAIGSDGDAPDADGTVTISGDKLLYTPVAGFAGDESFTYFMSDSVNTDVARVTVSVRLGDLVANPDSYGVFYEWDDDASAARAFSLPVVLNDRLQPPLDMTFAIVGLGVGTNAPDHGGTVEIAAGGQELLYRPATVPAPAFSERFTYEIADGAGRRASAAVLVRVTQRADILEAITQDDAFHVARNSVDNQLDVLANDGVRPGSAAGWQITAVAATSAHGGTVARDGALLRYTPAAGFVGVDTFGYAVSDGLGATGAATVSVRVGNLPTVPDRFVVLAGSVANVLDVLANDPLLPGYRDAYLLAGVAGATAGGTLALGVDNTVLYTPAPGYAGTYPYTERFDYTVRDDSGVTFPGRAEVAVHSPVGDRSTATITLVVEGRNDAPVIVNITTNAPITDKESAAVFTGVTIIEVDQQLQEPIDVEVAIDDPAKGGFTNLAPFVALGGGRYALTNVTAAAATAAIRQLVYVPVENRIVVPTTERVFFTITVTDNKSPPVSDTQSFLDVTAVNDPPLIGGTEAGQRFYYKLPIQPFAAVWITEVDDLALQALTVTVAVVESAQGIMRNLGDFASLGGGVYRATNITAAAATQQLRAMEFVAAGSVPVGGAVTTHLLLTVEDGFAPPVIDAVTSVVALNAYGATLGSGSAATWGNFGLAVDTIADFAVVGAPNADTNGTNSGVAFVYRHEPGSTNRWTQWRLLQPATVDAGDRFGRAVSIGDSHLAIGAPEQDVGGGQLGAVYIFRRDQGGDDNWGEWLRLTPTNVTVAGSFGLSVALCGDLLAVGAPDATIAGGAAGSGAVFLFGRHHGGSNAWGEMMRWAPAATGSAGSDFGWSVALSGETLIVGAPQFNSNTNPDPTAREGMVFHFQRDQGGPNQWGLRQTITAANAALALEFGWSVAVDGARLAVGAPTMTAGSIASAGRVYLYAHAVPTNDFAYVAQLDRSSDVAQRLFGYSLALDGGRLFAGAPENATTPHLGAAYLYEDRTAAGGVWTLIEKFTRPTGSVANLYGRAVGFRQGSAIVGAPASFATGVPPDRGHAFMYRFDYVPLNGISGLSARQFWDIDNFGDELGNPWSEDSLWGGTANPDGDNDPNDREYAFVGDPNVAGDAGVLWLARDGAGNWVLDYVRRANDPAIIFTIEASVDLETWFDWTAAMLSENITPLGAESEAATVVLQFSPAYPKMFFRVKATW